MAGFDKGRGRLGAFRIASAGNLNRYVSSSAQSKAREGSEYGKDDWDSQWDSSSGGKSIPFPSYSQALRTASYQSPRARRSRLRRPCLFIMPCVCIMILIFVISGGMLQSPSSIQSQKAALKSLFSASKGFQGRPSRRYIHGSPLDNPLLQGITKSEELNDEVSRQIEHLETAESKDSELLKENEDKSDGSNNSETKRAENEGDNTELDSNRKPENMENTDADPGQSEKTNGRENLNGDTAELATDSTALNEDTKQVSWDGADGVFGGQKLDAGESGADSETKVASGAVKDPVKVLKPQSPAKVLQTQVLFAEEGDFKQGMDFIEVDPKALKAEESTEKTDDEVKTLADRVSEQGKASEKENGEGVGQQGNVKREDDARTSLSSKDAEESLEPELKKSSAGNISKPTSVEGGSSKDDSSEEIDRKRVEGSSFSDGKEVKVLSEEGDFHLHEVGQSEEDTSDSKDTSSDNKKEFKEGNLEYKEEAEDEDVRRAWKKKKLGLIKESEVGLAEKERQQKENLGDKDDGVDDMLSEENVAASHKNRFTKRASKKHDKKALPDESEKDSEKDVNNNDREITTVAGQQAERNEEINGSSSDKTEKADDSEHLKNSISVVKEKEGSNDDADEAANAIEELGKAVSEDPKDAPVEIKDTGRAVSKEEEDEPKDTVAGLEASVSNEVARETEASVNDSEKGSSGKAVENVTKAAKNMSSDTAGKENFEAEEENRANLKKVLKGISERDSANGSLLLTNSTANLGSLSNTTASAVHGHKAVLADSDGSKASLDESSAGNGKPGNEKTDFGSKKDKATEGGLEIVEKIALSSRKSIPRILEDDDFENEKEGNGGASKEADIIPLSLKSKNEASKSQLTKGQNDLATNLTKNGSESGASKEEGGSVQDFISKSERIDLISDTVGELKSLTKAPKKDPQTDKGAVPPLKAGDLARSKKLEENSPAQLLKNRTELNGANSSTAASPITKALNQTGNFVSDLASQKSVQVIGGSKALTELPTKVESKAAIGASKADLKPSVEITVNSSSQGGSTRAPETSPVVSNLTRVGKLSDALEGRAAGSGNFSESTSAASSVSIKLIANETAVAFGSRTGKPGKRRGRKDIQ